MTETEVAGCLHENTVLRTFEFSDGSVHLVRQCLDPTCMEKVGTWLKRDLLDEQEVATATEFDHDGLATARVAYIAARWGHLRDDVCRLPLHEDPEYQEYMRSPQWAELRALVLHRDNGMCRGCGKLRARDVHHLSYDHLYSEFLFELVAVCRSCHVRWHGR